MSAALSTLILDNRIDPPERRSRQVGERMPDGTIYAGLSPDTQKPIYVSPKDAPLTFTFGEAAKYAAKLDICGHKDWRVPTKAELNTLFQNRAAIDGFESTGSIPEKWYWSSPRDGFFHAWAMRFRGGVRWNLFRTSQLALRCVRG